MRAACVLRVIAPRGALWARSGTAWTVAVPRRTLSAQAAPTAGSSASAAPEDVDHVARAAELEEMLTTRRAAHGGTLEHPEVMWVVLALFEQLASLNRLERLEELLTELTPIVEKDKEAKDGTNYSRVLQMRGLLKFKQQQFGECIQLWEEFRTRVGDSATLLENLGHAYSAAGKFAEAEKLFQTALPQCTQPGGVLFGLGLAAGRQGNFPAAYEHQKKALESWKAQYGAGHSLCARAMVGMAAALEPQGRLQEAEGLLREAVHTFTAALTAQSPVTAQATAMLTALQTKLAASKQ